MSPLKPHEVLSPEEIDALLSAVKSGGVRVSAGAERADAKAVIYNFRRPSRTCAFVFNMEPLQGGAVLESVPVEVANAYQAS